MPLPSFQVPFGNVTAVAAAGTTLGTATALVGNREVIVTSGSGGVALPTSFGLGQKIEVVNELAAGINVYPPTSGIQIDALGNGVGYFLPSAKSAVFTFQTASQIYSSALSNLLPETRVNSASSTTTVLGAAGSQYVQITGTTTITAFDTVDAGIVRDVLFGGSLTLTYNATSLILPSLGNITTAAGDTARFKSEGGGNWRCLEYTPASGKALVSPSPSQFVYGAVTATGTSQGGAASIGTTTYVNCNGGTSGTAIGILLPVATANTVIAVSNTNAFSITVFPASSGVIDGMSTNAGYIMSQGSVVEFIGINTTSWLTFARNNPVVAQYYVSTNQSISGTQQVNYDTKVIDTHNAVTTTTAGTAGTWKFTAPRPGFYSLQAENTNTGAGGSYYAYKNGSAYFWLGENSSGDFNISIDMIPLALGDTLDLRTNVAAISGNTPTSIGVSYIGIFST